MYIGSYSTEMNSNAFRVRFSLSLCFLLGVYTDGSSVGLGEKQTRANWLFGIQNILVYIYIYILLYI